MCHTFNFRFISSSIFDISLFCQCWDHFAHVGTVFPPCADPYGCARGDFCARRGGTYEVKLGSYQEGAHRQSEIDDTRGERHIFTPSHIISPSHRLKRQASFRKKVNRIPKRHEGEMQSVERWTLLLLLVGLKAQGEWRLFKVELYSIFCRSKTHEDFWLHGFQGSRTLEPLCASVS